MSASGTSRHFAAAQQFGRIWSEADITHRAGFMSTRPNSNWRDFEGWRKLRHLSIWLPKWRGGHTPEMSVTCACRRGAHRSRRGYGAAVGDRPAPDTGRLGLEPKFAKNLEHYLPMALVLKMSKKRHEFCIFALTCGSVPEVRSLLR
jgi:hypothetical protein